MISSPGIGSGLDVNSIVQKLMAVERQPVERLQAKKADYQAQLSAYGKLTSALSSFRDAMGNLDALSDLKLFSAASADEDVYTASAGSDAAAGSYDIEISRIAERHKLAASDANTYATTDDDIGASGTMSVTVGSETAFDVDMTGKSLAQIRDAINTHADNPGVTATIISDDVGNRLLLSADDTGSESFVQVAYSGADPFGLTSLNSDRDGSGSFTADDLDAVLTLEGQFTITRTSNTVDDAIAGITLDLKQAGSAELTVSRDVEAITEQAQAFVDAYNTLNQTISSLRSGALEADNTLLGIQRQMRGIFNTPPSGLSTDLAYLSDVGIAFQKDGTLSLDSDDLETALASDFNGVAELLADDDQGYAFRLKALGDSLLQTSGLIDAREDGLNDSVALVDSRVSQMERRLEITEDRYRQQFTALDGLVAELNKTSNFLTQQLSNLPFNNRG